MFVLLSPTSRVPWGPRHMGSNIPSHRVMWCCPSDACRDGGGYKQEKIFSCQPQSCSAISSWEGCWSHQPFPRQPAPNTTSSEQSPPGGAGDTAMPGRAHVFMGARATGAQGAGTGGGHVLPHAPRTLLPPVGSAPGSQSPGTALPSQSPTR